MKKLRTDPPAGNQENDLLPPHAADTPDSTDIATAAGAPGSTRSTDAIFLLRADHTRLKRLLRDVRRQLARGEHCEAEKTARRICRALTLHSAMEEDIFYPAVREALGGSDMLDHAAIEHAGAKSLCAQVAASHGGDATYAAKITVLANYTAEHMREEEADLFPRARRAGLDLRRLGERMLARWRDARAEYDEHARATDATEAGGSSDSHASDIKPPPLPGSRVRREQIGRPGIASLDSRS